jgi:hypothetical protein
MKFKRLLAAFLAAVMLLGIMPVTLAAQWGEGEIVVVAVATAFECPPSAARLEQCYQFGAERFLRSPSQRARQQFARNRK